MPLLVGLLTERLVGTAQRCRSELRPDHAVERSRFSLAGKRKKGSETPYIIERRIAAVISATVSRKKIRMTVFMAASLPVSSVKRRLARRSAFETAVD
jgi:hypothetical protein